MIKVFAPPTIRNGKLNEEIFQLSFSCHTIYYPDLTARQGQWQITRSG